MVQSWFLEEKPKFVFQLQPGMASLSDSCLLFYPQRADKTRSMALSIGSYFDSTITTVVLLIGMRCMMKAWLSA